MCMYVCEGTVCSSDGGSVCSRHSERTAGENELGREEDESGRES